MHASSKRRRSSSPLCFDLFSKRLAPLLPRLSFLYHATRPDFNHRVAIMCFVRFIQSSGYPPSDSAIRSIPPVVPAGEDDSLRRTFKSDYGEVAPSGAHGRHYAPHPR